MVNSSYLNEIKANLPRILSLFDTDRTSASYGIGDRYHWAWGLIDFGNGTFQGAAHGLARLWHSKMWPFDTSQKKFLSRINSIFEATNSLKRNDGSLEEAFPHEGSYCVTALVAFDLLCAKELLDKEISREMSNRWTTIIASMIDYLIKADETHAIISNHLATSVAALVRWNLLTGDKKAEKKARDQLNKIILNQSEEGWYKEYEGADPGYQSLCIYYLADVHKLKPEWKLLDSLTSSINFLWYFAHPDGSFGGLYGSRSTRFYYPAGVMALADEIPEAAILSEFMKNSIKDQKVVTLSAVDEPNLIPMFNAYACSAVMLNQLQTTKKTESTKILPCQDQKSFRKYLPQAGLLLDRGTNHYTIISTHKGGVVYHFNNRSPAQINAGLVLQDNKSRLGSTQSYNKKNIFFQKLDKIEITSQISLMNKKKPKPFHFILLRLFSLTIFRFSILREWFKKYLVNMLITKRKFWSVENKRSIQLGADLQIDDEINKNHDYKILNNASTFVPIHMASQGYWQVQDEDGET
ncbi:hypothetical protein [Candidatus Pelagibacter bacterium nBUS_28]|uniref:hypothetical protein n=1 Tax=Candidatus Pelagibacter bacterium nBUS_28 TaxID=3374189 RepID=UPI003EBA217F